MILEGIATGGFLGVLGPVISRVGGYFEKRQEHKMNIELAQIKKEQDADKFDFDKVENEANRTHEIRLHELQQSARAAETEQENRVIEASLIQTREKGSYNALAEGHKANAEMTKHASQWVIDAQVMTRIILTIALTVFLFSTLFIAKDHRETIVQALITVSVASIMWWFHDRSALRLNKLAK